MEHYAGIDVSLEQSSVCVVDATGRIVREAKVASEPAALVGFFQQLGVPMTRIGLEAGPLSQWLHAGLAGAGLEMVLLETRQVKAALSAMVVKTDRKDARGIAQLLRMGWFRPVHRKSPTAQEVRALLVGRKLVQAKLLDVELSIRGILRGFGLKVGTSEQGPVRGPYPRSRRWPADAGAGGRADVAGARGPAHRVPRAAPGHARGRPREHDVPSADDGAGRRRVGGVSTPLVKAPNPPFEFSPVGRDSRTVGARDGGLAVSVRRCSPGRREGRICDQAGRGGDDF